MQNYPVAPGHGYPTGGVVWYTMAHSDQFKPMGQSASLGIKYTNVDRNFMVYNQRLETGSSRFFNWVDYDGSGTLRENPTLVTGWPSWWKVQRPAGTPLEFFHLGSRSDIRSCRDLTAHGSPSATCNVVQASSSPGQCEWRGAWGVWLCDFQPWRQPARLDVRVPGYTVTTAGKLLLESLPLVPIHTT